MPNIDKWGLYTHKLHHLIKYLLKHHLTIATAESIKGGLLAKTFTDVPGSSYWFKSGVVSYSDEIKHKILNVKQETLDKCSAVSVETAIEMAEGVLYLLNADVAISTTGYAGPTGEDVGKVCFSVAVQGKETQTKEVKFSSKLSRTQIREQSVSEAISFILSVLNEAKWFVTRLIFIKNKNSA